MDRILYFYRENAGGLTGSYHRDTFEDQIAAWEAFDEYTAAWSGDTFKGIVDERKTLTCCICIASLVFSDLPVADKKNELDKIMSCDFYERYALKELPDWAPEEDVFIHDLMKGQDPRGQLLNLGVKHRIKSFVKGILHRD